MLFSLVVISLAVLTTDCKKDEDEPVVTQVTGTASFPAGTSGDLSNAKVSLYLTYDDWLNNSPIKFGAVSGSGATVNFTISGLNPGNYYLDVWKDIDNSGTWTSGDYVGWYGSGGLGAPALTPFMISTGQTFSCSITMYIIAERHYCEAGNQLNKKRGCSTRQPLFYSIIWFYQGTEEPVAVPSASSSGLP